HVITGPSEASAPSLVHRALLRRGAPWTGCSRWASRGQACATGAADQSGVLRLFTPRTGAAALPALGRSWLSDRARFARIPALCPRARPGGVGCLRQLTLDRGPRRESRLSASLDTPKWRHFPAA